MIINQREDQARTPPCLASRRVSSDGRLERVITACRKGRLFPLSDWSIFSWEHSMSCYIPLHDLRKTTTPYSRTPDAFASPVIKQQRQHQFSNARWWPWHTTFWTLAPFGLAHFHKYPRIIDSCVSVKWWWYWWYLLSSTYKHFPFSEIAREEGEGDPNRSRLRGLWSTDVMRYTLYKAYSTPPTRRDYLLYALSHDQSIISK